jgi:hypothetical protein
MSRLLNLIPYILAGGTIVLAFLQIIKEWEEYEKKRWLRLTVFGVLVIVALLTFVSLRLDEKNREKEKLQSESDIHDLKGKVDAATVAQEANTKLFVESLGKMSTEVGNLKVEVKTEALQKKLASVQADLQKTQKALAPRPKAELTFTFVPFNNPPIHSSLKASPANETNLVLRPDGSVHIEFTIINLTEAEATNISLNLQICDGCKYAKEPDGMEKDIGLVNQETTRLWNVPRIEPMQGWKTMSIDVVPPPKLSTFPLGFSYRCSTCILTKELSLGTVHILGRVP